MTRRGSYRNCCFSHFLYFDCSLRGGATTMCCFNIVLCCVCSFYLISRKIICVELEIPMTPRGSYRNLFFTLLCVSIVLFSDQQRKDQILLSSKSQWLLGGALSQFAFDNFLCFDFYLFWSAGKDQIVLSLKFQWLLGGASAFCVFYNFLCFL